MNIDEQIDFIAYKLSLLNPEYNAHEIDVTTAILSTLKEVKKMRSYANKMNDYLDPRNKGGE